MGTNFISMANNIAAQGKDLEQGLGRGAIQPFNAANSGSRKLMHSIHEYQAPEAINGEKPILETGNEILYGDKSSSIVTLDSDYIVLAKIPKFSFNPDHHYILILKDLYSNKTIMHERISYKFNIEVYGYLYNNQVADSLQVGMTVPKNTTIRKSLAYDKYNNRTPGKNLLTLYLSDERNLEDSLILLDETAKDFSIPIFHPVTIIKNPNDIMLNLYGNDEIYKCWPDIGEYVNAILVALRRENKETASYSQAYDRLREIMISDDTFTTKGRVVDIDVYCNNPDLLANSIYTSQMYMYYTESMRFNSDIVNTMTNLKSQGLEFSYQLEKLYTNAKRILSGSKYSDDPSAKKEPADSIIKFMIIEERPIEIGDKMVDRYGGKGVVSYILPKEQMPKLPNGKPVQIIKNQLTTYGRENIGQLMELDTTFIGRKIIEFISTGVLKTEEALTLIYQYYGMLSGKLAESFAQWVNSLKSEEQDLLVNMFVEDGCIHMSLSPINECINIDKLCNIYNQFPWIEKEYLTVPIEDSNGNFRQVQSLRSTVVSWIYNYRLKQFAEEKFSATSLSSTNLTNMNTKSNASKGYKEPFPNTPIKWGNMESGNWAHLDPRLGSMYTIVNHMIHSLSPHARREVEQMQTGDPYHVDIKLNTMAGNRAVEIINCYLKTMGYRIKFVPIRVVRKTPVVINPVKCELPLDIRKRQPVWDMRLSAMDNYRLNKGEEIVDRKKHPVVIRPVKFI